MSNLMGLASHSKFLIFSIGKGTRERKGCSQATSLAIERIIWLERERREPLRV